LGPMPRPRARPFPVLSLVWLANVDCAVSPARSAPRPSLTDRVFDPVLLETPVAQRTPIVRMPGFVSDAEIEAIHAAADRVRARVGEVARSNSLTGNAAPGSWRTVYLNHQLAELLPDLRERLVAAACDADSEQWGVLEAMGITGEDLSVRCCEHHTVRLSGGLPIEKHFDYGSVFTLDLMLSDTSEFEGGTFCTLEAKGGLKAHEFQRGDLLIFLSHKYHCVEPVTRGTRRVLVTELWQGLERRCNQRCDIPWGPCACRLDDSRLYVRHRKGDFVDFASVPFSYKSPQALKLAWGRFADWQARL